MPTKTKHTLNNAFYFITFSCYRWLHLFEVSNVYDYFIRWTNQLKKRGVAISGYVIMPNHLHLLVFKYPKYKDLNATIGNSKRFLAYEIVKRLEADKNWKLIEILQKGVMPEEKAKAKKHQVFRPSFDAKLVEGEDQIVRVLDYIHHNPVSKKWMLVDDFVAYPYSSAQYYFTGKQNAIEVLDYRDVWNKT